MMQINGEGDSAVVLIFRTSRCLGDSISSPFNHLAHSLSGGETGAWPSSGELSKRTTHKLKPTVSVVGGDRVAVIKLDTLDE